ncbi:hypothetical protein [Peterkaempfera sp. SMS 1(5)a]|uniref:hypothetical protein n=1 Tax=Peterkaempfera podocarpi TaxID=3232308 RepID=UPI0036715643
MGWEVFTQLSRSGVKTGFLDLDQIALIPGGGTHGLRARNLAAMWPNFRSSGTRCLVLAGFVDTVDEVREYTELLPDASWTLCRLRVGAGELKERFLARGWFAPELADEAVAGAMALDSSGLTDICVDTDGLAVPEVARLVIEQVGSRPDAAPALTSGSVDPVATAVSAAAPAAVLWFSGATAVGKSTVGYEVFRQVARAGVPVAYLDLKQIGTVRPAADDDPEYHRLKARNLAALWAGYREDGARYLIVSGDADRDDTVSRYADLLPGATLTVCRLHAGPATLAERVAQRGRGGGPVVPGDEIRGLSHGALQRIAERAAHDAEALERAGAGELRVTTDDRPVQDVVGQVLAHIGGWLEVDGT